MTAFVFAYPWTIFSYRTECRIKNFRNNKQENHRGCKRKKTNRLKKARFAYGKHMITTSHACAHADVHSLTHAYTHTRARVHANPVVYTHDMYQLHPKQHAITATSLCRFLALPHHEGAAVQGAQPGPVCRLRRRG